MADKDFKVKNGIDLAVPLPIVEGGTGQTSATNAFNALLPAQTGHANKFLQSDGTNTSWAIPAKGLNSGTLAQRPGSASNGDLYFNTDDMEIEVYQNGNWLIANITPGSPTGVTATNQGTGRAFNDGQASIAFTAATSGGPVKTFTVTPTPTTSPATFSGSSSPITVTNLASSTQYTYTVAASSNIGTSAASAASAGVTATTVPQAPTLSAAAGDTQATITITPGSTGGSAITQYSITSSPTTTTQTTSNTTYTFTGLTNGTSYTFTVTATNSNGTSLASAASNSIIPAVPDTGSIFPLGIITLTSNAGNVEFTNIPQTYTHLQLKMVALGDTTTGYDTYIQFNSDTATNYSLHRIGGNGTQSFATGYVNTNFLYLVTDAARTLYPASSVTDILDYRNINKFKTVRTLGGVDTNGGGQVALWSGNWRNKNAITSIKISVVANNFAPNALFALYGVNA